jgi:DNA polymerase-3 subunit beta
MNNKKLIDSLKLVTVKATKFNHDLTHQFTLVKDNKLIANDENNIQIEASLFDSTIKDGFYKPTLLFDDIRADNNGEIVRFDTSNDNYTHNFNIESSELITGLLDASIYACTDDTQCICSILLEFSKNNGLRVVATDGHRMFVKNLTSSLDAQLDAEFSAILPEPKKISKIISNLLSDTNTINIKISKKHTSFFNNDLTVTCLNVDDNYPNYRQPIPKNTSTQLEIDTKSVRLKLMKVSELIVNIGTDKKSQAFKLECKDGEASLTFKETDKRIELGGYDGKDLTTGFKTYQVLEILSHTYKKFETITINLDCNSSPIVFKQGYTQESILMPMRFK